MGGYIFFKHELFELLDYETFPCQPVFGSNGRTLLAANWVDMTFLVFAMVNEEQCDLEHAFCEEISHVHMNKWMRVVHLKTLKH